MNYTKKLSLSTSILSIKYRNEIISLKHSFYDLWEVHGDENYLGTRETIQSEEGKELGDYTWRNYNEVKNDAIALSKYFAENELYAKTFLKKEDSGWKKDRDFSFIGIFAKNRDEWVVSDLACIF